jgi:hypothetical protein
MSYPSFVLKEKIDICEDRSNDARYRYFIKIPFSHNPKNKILVIMKNPSSAETHKSDPTMGKVLKVLYHKGYDEVSIVNLFSFSSTTPIPMVKYCYSHNDGLKRVIGLRNDEIIKSFINNYEKVIIAWGKYPKNSKATSEEKAMLNKFIVNYKIRISQVMNMLKPKKIYFINSIAKGGIYPLHGLRWNKDMDICEFHYD